MLGLSRFDELIGLLKKLSVQISTLSLTLSQGAIASTGACACDAAPAGGKFPVESANHLAFDDPEKRNNGLKRAATPTLPDARLIRRIIRQRQQRERFFNSELLSDPVWDMLLDLAAATAEYRKVSVTSLCIASRVPPSTALRWIGLMAEQGLVLRIEDPLDRRRVFIALSEKAMSDIARYFESLGADAKVMV
jgi:DNA-binding MarR family transcriptional regulator